MKSDFPKVLFEVNEDPLCWGPFRALVEECDKVVIVIGYRGEDVKERLLKRASDLWTSERLAGKIQFVTQAVPLGTGDAVKCAVEGLGRQSLNGHEDCVVLNGDLPLFRSETLRDFVKQAKESRCESACLSATVAEPAQLGRIVRDPLGVFDSIREAKDASPDELLVQEINGGVYYFKMDLLTKAVANLSNDNKQKEFYLTDLLGQKSHKHRKSEAIVVKNPQDILGVNTTAELSAVRKIAQARLQKQICEDFGVEFLNADTVTVSALAKFSGPCTLGPGVSIRGRSVIGNGVFIDGQVLIDNSVIQDGAKIFWGSVVEESVVGPRSTVGPLARLRPGSRLDEKVRVGNFVELKKTHMKSGSKAAHLSYLGDCEVGEEANIGCGTITCNFDGFKKHQTKIGKRAFIGSDSQLVAPIEVGDDAYVGSGTTVTGDIPAGALALSRPDLIIKPGYAKRLAEKLAEKKKND